MKSLTSSSINVALTTINTILTILKTSKTLDAQIDTTAGSLYLPNFTEDEQEIDAQRISKHKVILSIILLLQQIIFDDSPYL